MPYKDPADWKAWRLRNHERQLAKERVYQAAYREKNREADRAKGKRYYETHREEVLARKREWNASEAGRAWFENYRVQHRENVRTYQARNPEVLREQYRRWYYRDLAQSRTRKVDNQARRRARKADAGGVASYEQVMARVAFYGNRCYLCRVPWEHIDHVIPLAQGGSNWPSNLRPICAACNFSKHTQSLKEVTRSRLNAVSA